METSMLTSKGQLLIPKRLRTKYGITAGVKVAFIESKDGLLLKAMDEAYFDQFAGLLKDAVPTREEYNAWKSEDRRNEEAPKRTDGATAKRAK
jgi:bifunctional DNA-binding transcriptional regulator/antitoxin component of YhaV-PrlF toxin-antitoxin module